MVGFRTALIPRSGLQQFLIPSRHRSTVYSIYLMAKKSSSAQCMTLPNYFSHPSLVIYFSPTPPIKVRLGLQRGGRLLNSNSKPPWPIFMIDQSKGGISSSQIIFITLFYSRCWRLCSVLNQPQQTRLRKNAGPNQFCWAKPTCFDFFHPIVICRVTYESLREWWMAAVHWPFQYFYRKKNCEPSLGW